MYTKAVKNVNVIETNEQLDFKGLIKRYNGSDLLVRVIQDGKTLIDLTGFNIPTLRDGLVDLLNSYEVVKVVETFCNLGSYGSDSVDITLADSGII